MVKDRKGRKAIEHKRQQLERLVIEYVPTESIRPNAYNPNKQSEAEHEMLLRSIQDNGFTQPVIVTTEGVIVDGEHRWRAAQSLGMVEIPIVRVDMTPEQMRIATLSHNKARGSHDLELEVQVLRDLEALGALSWAQDSLLISDEEIQKLLADIPAPESLMSAEFSQAWEPDSVTADGDADFLSQTETATQRLDSGHVRSMTQQTMERVREREAKIKAAKTEQDRQAAKQDKDFYRLSLVFYGDEALLVKGALGKEPAAKLVEMCHGL